MADALASRATSPNRKRAPWWRRAVDRTPFYSFNLCSLGVGVLGIGGLTSHLSDLPKHPLGWLAILLFLGGLIGLVFVPLKDSTEFELREQNRQTQEELAEAFDRSSILSMAGNNTFRAVVHSLATALGLNECDRITLYLVPPQGDYTAIGRFADHDDYDTVKKPECRRGAGVVHLATTKNSLVAVELTADPTTPTTYESWISEQIAQGLDEATARKLRMRSLAYAAMRLRAAERTVAVVVCESTQRNRFIDRTRVSREIERHGPVLTAFALEAAKHGDYLSAGQRGAGY